jgi:hypothetical protein
VASSSSQPPPPAAGAMPAPPATAKAKGKAGGKVRTIDIEEGETIVAGEPTVRQLPMGRVVWANGQGKREIWGLIDIAGELAQGGGTWHEKSLAKLNLAARDGVDLVVGLQGLEDKFRLELFKVKSAAKEGAKGLAEVKKLGPAIAKRMKGDEDFYEDVKGFTTALAAAKKSAKEVAKAAKDFDAATHALKAAVFDEKTYQAKKDVEQAESAVNKKQAQIAEAKAIFNKVLDIAGKVVKQQWGAIASMALEYAQDKARDVAAETLVAGRLIEQLEALKAQLEQARTKVGEFEKGALDEKLLEMQDRLESAAKALEMSHDALHEAVAELPGAQRNAINELAESKSTAPAGKMIEARAKQIGDVEAARAACAEYLRLADKVDARMKHVIDLFRQIGPFLEKAAKDKPYYAEDKPYGRELYRASLKNSIAFADWSMSIPAVKREAEDAVKWLAKTDADGPLGSFDQAIESTRKDLGRA